MKRILLYIMAFCAFQMSAQTSNNLFQSFQQGKDDYLKKYESSNTQQKNSSNFSQQQSIYVDLGLPSGTLWKSHNENGYYNYDQAIERFGSNLPTKDQWEELKNLCTWTWTARGYEIKGPSGKSITLPAACFRDCWGNVFHSNIAGELFGQYWSSTPRNSEYAWDLEFMWDFVRFSCVERCNGNSVRLIKEGTPKSTKQVPQGYVDLGLPSGTLWKNQNEESGFYSYDQAMAKFGNNLPTKEQVEELKNKCSWTWTGNSYKVVGPNGLFITLPAMGWHDCNGNIAGIGTGAYWTSDSSTSTSAWNLYFDSSDVGVWRNCDKCFCLPVRLVR